MTVKVSLTGEKVVRKRKVVFLCHHTVIGHKGIFLIKAYFSKDIHLKVKLGISFQLNRLLTET